MIEPTPDLFDKKAVLELQMGLTPIVLIIGRDLSSKGLYMFDAFQKRTRFVATNPPLIDQLQVDKYKGYVLEYGELNEIELPDKFVFCAIPDEEITSDVDQFLSSICTTFLILENVSPKSKKLFEGYEPKIEYDY